MSRRGGATVPGIPRQAEPPSPTPLPPTVPPPPQQTNRGGALIDYSAITALIEAGQHALIEHSDAFDAALTNNQWLKAGTLLALSYLLLFCLSRTWSIIARYFR